MRWLIMYLCGCGGSQPEHKCHDNAGKCKQKAQAYIPRSIAKVIFVLTQQCFGAKPLPREQLKRFVITLGLPAAS